MFDYIRLPANLPATLSLVWPSGGRFLVTAKGRTGARRQRAALPALLLVLGAALLAALLWAIMSLAGWTPTRYPSTRLALVSISSLLVTLTFVGAAAHRMRDLRFGVERREGHRFGASLPALLAGVPANVVDASMGGLQVEVAGDGFAVGDRLPVEVTVPTSADCVRLNVVVRSRTGAVHRVQFEAHQWVALAELSAFAVGAGRARVLPAAPAAAGRQARSA